MVEAVRKQPGMRLSELALAARVNKHSLKALLKRVAGQVEAKGVRAGTKYWPKEAL